ncbi:glycosyltransferase [Oceanidesulfovibrio indonesiensis]|uniref:Glycosyltransferase n=1 Tax=Oceanidesulfovibrio indonesiensis TaxID=54767 RepID=A0A7M3MBD7_9BACT|nr:glycosyltransferase family 2 protein [Oceanidesulfovibrio indonesiensis]TVM15497.1 glycosyltransferase [Oceanidesulfovibrio indonesiensis]
MTTEHTPEYSLVIPVYRNAENIPHLLPVLEEMWENTGRNMEVVFIVDGSPDNSFEMLRQALPQTPYPAQLLEHSRNFGSFAAIRTGMGVARGSYMAAMAADLQEPPELVLEMFETLANDNADVVFGQRSERDDPFLYKLLSQTFWKIYRKWVIPEIPEGGVDVFGCNRRVRDAVLSLSEANSSLVAQLFWVGYRRAFLPYKRRKREQGVSAWSMRKRLKYMLDSILSFTNLPIMILFWIGLLGVTISALLAIVVLGAWFMGSVGAKGYTPLMLALVFFSSLQLLATGIVGFYLWRIFENTKCRPATFVSTALRFDPENSRGDHGR